MMMPGNLYVAPQHLPNMPAPPPLTRPFNRITHSLPLPIHLILTCIHVSLAFLTALVSHVVTGPIHQSWRLQSSLLHAIIKSFIICNPPQGRHSMAVTRFFGSLTVPAWAVGAAIKHCQLVVEVAGDKWVRHGVARVAGVVATGEHGMRVVPAEWVTKSSVIRDDRVVLYLHGGAHIFMSPRTHRSITSNLASSLQCKVLALDYRLAPENQFPSAVEDALAAYCALIGHSITTTNGTTSVAKIQTDDASLSPTSSTVFKPSQVMIAGDSSGGCLATQLLIVLAALSIPQPASAILLSPFVDNERRSPSWRRNWDVDYLTLCPLGVGWALRCVAPTSVPDSHELFSPVNADLSGVTCRLLIQVGGGEVLLDDSVRLHERALACGVRSELQVFGGMVHVFQTFSGFFDAAAEAFVRMRVFVDGTLKTDFKEEEQTVVRKSAKASAKRYRKQKRRGAANGARKPVVVKTLSSSSLSSDFSDAGSISSGSTLCDRENYALLINVENGMVDDQWLPYSKL